MALFEIRDVAKSFSEEHVLHGVNLDIHSGEFLTIIGKSGSGKSLLVKSLIGLVVVDSGSITFDGMELTELTETQWVSVRRRIGMLFQESALFDSLNVIDNVAYALREQNVASEKEIAERVSEALTLVSLPGIEEMWPGDLSGGMRKRVALARAIALRPEVVIYDEPTEGLDPINVTRVNRLLQHLRKSLGITTIVVTHNMQSAFETSDRLAFIDQGEVVITGTPDAFRRSQDPRLTDFIAASHRVPRDYRER